MLNLVTERFPQRTQNFPSLGVCEEPGGAGGLLIEDLHFAQVASAANICFCLSLLISSLTPLGTSRFPHVLWVSLYLFCGPLRGRGDFLLLPQAILRL